MSPVCEKESGVHDSVNSASIVAEFPPGDEVVIVNSLAGPSDDPAGNSKSWKNVPFLARRARQSTSKFRTSQVVDVSHDIARTEFGCRGGQV